MRLLPPYSRNVGTRLTKSPTVFLRDTGLLHHVQSISSLGDPDSNPVRGASWETFVLEDLVRKAKLRNLHTQFHFWRIAAVLTNGRSSFDRGSERVIFEIKTGEGEPARAGQRLRSAMTDAHARRGFLFHAMRELPE